MHNFIFVTVLDKYFAKCRSWDDLQTSLDRDAQRVEPDFGDQLSDRGPGRHPAVLTVDPYACTAV